MKVLLLLMIAITLTASTLATYDCSPAFRTARSELQQLKATLSLQGDTLRRYDAVMATLRRLETQAGNATHEVSPKSTPASSTPAPSTALPTLTGGPDLNVTTPNGYWYRHVVALPGGEALVTTVGRYPQQVVRLDRHGREVPPAFTPRTTNTTRWTTGWITGLIVDGEDVYVLRRGGVITKTRLSSLNHTRAEWILPGMWEMYPGALVGNELYLLEDSKKIAFSLDLESGNTTTRTKLESPMSITTAVLGKTKRVFIISEFWGGRISIFNDTWDLINTIGQQGRGDGQLYNPKQVLVTPWSTLLVADMWNHRVTEFSLTGRWLRHLLTSRDGLSRTKYLSYSRPYLWVTDYSPDGYYHVRRYKLVA